MFNITPEALDYIKRKGQNITLYMQELIYSSWRAPQAASLVPAVRVGKPQNDGKIKYIQHTINGINIWQADNVNPIQTDVPIEIGLKKNFFFHKLTISKARELELI